MSNYRYQGNNHPFAVVLCHSQDKAALESLFAEIEKSGLRLCLMEENGVQEKTLKKACSVLAVFTEHFYENSELMNAFMKAGYLNKECIPIRADKSVMPEVLSIYNYATNSVNLGKYTLEEAVRKIRSSDALKEPKITAEQSRAYKNAMIGMIAAAAAFVAVFAVIITLSMKKPAAEEAKEIVIPQIGEMDVESVSSVFLLGDEIIYSKFEKTIDEVLQEDGDEEEGYRWFYKDSGEEVTHGGYDDLAFLGKFPNLKYLIMIEQDQTQLPDLSGLEKLIRVEIYNCDFEDLEGLRGAKALSLFNMSNTPVSDLSPLTSIPTLSAVKFMNCPEITSLSGFGPEGLLRLYLFCPNLRDISGLNTCTNLGELMIVTQEDLHDYSALGSCKKLKEVEIRAENARGDIDFSALSSSTGMTKLGIVVNGKADVDFLSSLSYLKEFNLVCEDIANFEAIRSCKNLTVLNLCAHSEPYINMDVMDQMVNLSDLELIGVRGDLSFLEGISREKAVFTKILVVSEDMDYSGLSHLTYCEEINIQTSNYDGVLEPLRNVRIGRLVLNNCRDLDISELPTDVAELALDQASLTSLNGLPCRNLQSLSLNNMTNLTSLDGIEELEKLTRITTGGCIRLNNWDALYGKTLDFLCVANQLSLPDFSRFDLAKGAMVRLESIPDMEDLSVLDGIPDETAQGQMWMTVTGPELQNLNALMRFKLKKLEVPSSLADQAADLKARGCTNEFRLISFDESNENNIGIEIEAGSFEELQNLPRAYLKYVTSLQIAGDLFYPYDSYGCDMWMEGENVHTVLRSYESGDEVEISMASDVLDLSVFSELTGLRRLSLVCQKIENIQMLQNLEDLQELIIVQCEVEDISTVFALDTLERLTLGGKNITAIQGIQNLYNLWSLNLENSSVTDLSPLSELPVSPRAEEEGFELIAPRIQMEDQEVVDLHAAASMPRFCSIILNGYRDGSWIDVLRGKEIGEGVFLNSFTSNEELGELVKSVKSIRRLCISWNEQLTDLSCLMDLEGLEELQVSPDMEEAAAKLREMDPAFEIRMEG